MAQRYIVLRGLFLISCLVKVNLYGAAYEEKIPKFTDYFKVGFLPYKSDKKADVLFWCYYPGLLSRNEPQYVGLYHVKGSSSFITFLKKFAKNNTAPTFDEMLNFAYLKHRGIQGSDQDGASTPEIEDIKIMKAEASSEQSSDEFTRLHEEIVGNTKREDLNLTKYYDLVEKYLKTNGYEGTFVSMLPEEAKTFFNKVEAAMGQRPIQWIEVEQKEITE